MASRFRTRRRAVVVVATVLFAAAGGGCGSDDQSFGRAAVRADVLGRSYEATGARDRDLVEGGRVVIGFGDRTLGTFGGCNGTQGSTYAVTVGTLQVSGEASSTLMGCGAELEGQEEWWNRFLAAGPRALVRDDGEQLELSTGKETVTLVSKPRPESRRVVSQERIEQYEQELMALSTNLQVRKDKLRDQVKKGRATTQQGKSRKQLQQAYDKKVEQANPFPGLLVTQEP